MVEEVSSSTVVVVVVLSVVDSVVVLSVVAVVDSVVAVVDSVVAVVSATVAVVVVAAVEPVGDVPATGATVVDVALPDVLELSVSVVLISSKDGRVVLPPSMVVSSQATVHVVVVELFGAMITPPE